MTAKATEKKPETDSKNVEKKVVIKNLIEKESQVEENKNENVKKDDPTWKEILKLDDGYDKQEMSWENFEKYIKLDKANRAIKSIMLPYKHINSKCGKGFRSKMGWAICKYFKVEDQYGDKERKLIEMIQNASLLLDDIQDGSFVRRGIPCAHLVYGIPATINSANYFSYICLKLVTENTKPEKTKQTLLNCFDAVFKLHEGQAMEMYWRDNLIIPTEEEYRQMIDLKTGTFFRQLPKSIIELDFDTSVLDRFLYLIGQYFQIKDDYMNLKSENYTELKGFAEDISEGKFSFPIIHACNQFPDDNTIMNILKMRTQDPKLKMIVIKYLEDAGSFEYTEKVLEGIAKEIKVELDSFDYEQSFKDEVMTLFLEGHKRILEF